MHNIERISDSRCHDFLSIQYLDKESCHFLSKILPILSIKWFFPTYGYADPPPLKSGHLDIKDTHCATKN